MKNKNKILLTLILFLISNVLLLAQPGDTDGTDNLEGVDTPAAPIDDWLPLLFVLGLRLGYYILKTRKQISE
jgi:hypothetical protein